MLVDDVQVLLHVESDDKEKYNPYQEFAKLENKNSYLAPSKIQKNIYFETEGWLESSVYFCLIYKRAGNQGPYYN